MNSAEREELIAAYQNWRAAEMAYQDEVRRHVAAASPTDPTPVPDPEVITADALRQLRELRVATEEAQRRYELLATA